MQHHVLALPSAHRELVRFYTFSPSELAWIRKRRGAHNRLGFAVQLALLKHPGRMWTEETVLPDMMLRYIAQQIHEDPAALSHYAARDVTRREHVAELQSRLGWTVFSGRAYRDLAMWLMASTRATDRAVSLVEMLLEELPRRKILAPRLSVVERLVRETRRRARQDLYRVLSQDLTETQRRALDSLLEARADSRQITVAWLREPQRGPHGQHGQEAPGATSLPSPAWHSCGVRPAHASEPAPAISPGRVACVRQSSPPL